MSTPKHYDLLVIGAGINGAGIARDASGRGLKVLLCEQGDIGGATSSASTKLIHGGLRYLERYAFRLVRESLAEREVVMRQAPHLVRPMRFVLPHAAGMRPAWMVRAGLFLYDHMGRRNTLPPSTSVGLSGSAVGAGLKHKYRKGFMYSDCWTDDARLVVLNARGAADLGCRVRVRTRCEEATYADGLWHVRLHDRLADGTDNTTARAIVNAAGPWVGQVLTTIHDVQGRGGIRLVKGSHIVVPRLHEGEHALLLQNDDGRVVFVIPFEGDYSLIGTTEIGIDEVPDPVEPSAQEVEYLCAAVARYFEHPPTPADVVWSFAGVRPLYDDGETDPGDITRDYVLELDDSRPGAPVLSVYGGKLTTYRCLAETVLARLSPFFPELGAPWTHDSPLPGGDIRDMEAFVTELRISRPELPGKLLAALARRYGTRIQELLGDAQRSEELGEYFGAGLYAREVDYLIDCEWACIPEDVLWRRTKTGLSIDQDGISRLTGYMSRKAKADINHTRSDYFVIPAESRNPDQEIQ